MDLDPCRLSFYTVVLSAFGKECVVSIAFLTVIVKIKPAVFVFINLTLGTYWDNTQISGL